MTYTKDFVGINNDDKYHQVSSGRDLLDRKMQRWRFGEAVNEMN